MNNNKIYQEYNFKCSKCSTRYPDDKAKCFVCGSDSFRLDKILKKVKEKSSIKGATLNINF